MTFRGVVRALHVILPRAENSKACGGAVFDGRLKFYSHAFAVKRLIETLGICLTHLQRTLYHTA